MSPSIYIGCSIRDEIADALHEVNKTFKEIEDEGKTALANLSNELEKIRATTKKYAEVTLGSTTDNQVLWKAEEAGADGNEIGIVYDYKGPDYVDVTLTGAIKVMNGISNIAGVGTSFTTEVGNGDTIRIEDSLGVHRTYTIANVVSDIAISLTEPYGGATETGLNGYVDVRRRPPISSVEGTVITCSLAVASNGEIDPSYDMSATLTEWLTNTDVTDLVGASLVGSGADLPETIPLTFLEGGQGTPLKDAEEASNTIAKQFGHNKYQSLMRSIDIPVVESAEDAAAYLESVDDEIVIINKKLFLVEGTNLTGFRLLYNTLGKDVSKLKEYVEKMSSVPALPHVFLTENIEFPNYAEVCGKVVYTPTIQETLRAYDEALEKVANKYTNGDVAKLNSYILWIEKAKQTVAAYNKLNVWGFDELYITYILDGETPEISEDDFAGYAQIPTVAVIEDPNLFVTLKFTDSEIAELLDKDIPGIKVPKQDDPSKTKDKIADLLRNDRETLPNGMRSKVKKPIAAAQAINLSKTGGDTDLSKEMATRGRGCARQLKNMRSSVNTALNTVENTATGAITEASDYISGNLANADLPNLPSADLPDVASKVEAAFGALSSVVNSASRLFDRMIDGIVSTVSPVLNTVQNLMSLAENLVNNDLTQCLLGTVEAATGSIKPPSLSGGGASVGSLTVGGIPIPMSILGAALKELSATLDATITSAFEAMMKIVEKPLCMVMSILDDILGFDLGAATNPCKEGKDPNTDCPPEDVQEIINDSNELSTVYDTLSRANLFPKESAITDVEDSVEDFTGAVKKTVTTTSQSISRGITEVMEDITKSVESKVDFLNEFDKAIKKLLGEDSSDMALSIDESVSTQESCAPASVGALTDAITEFI